jgi:hypothetical protein
VRRNARDDSRPPLLSACLSYSRWRWRSTRALSALTLPAFDAELLAAAPSTIKRLTLFAVMLPYAFFLAAVVRARFTHLALPHFVRIPPAAHDVLASPPPRCASPCSTAVPASRPPAAPCDLRIASTLRDGPRRAEGVLAPRSGRAWLLGTRANTGVGLKVLEMSLDGTSDEVRGCPPPYHPKVSFSLAASFHPEPGDARELCGLCRMGLCDLREAPSSTRPVSSRWTHAK